MPLNQKGSRVFATSGSGYREQYVKKNVKRCENSHEEKVRRRVKENLKNRKTTSYAQRLRSPRI